MCYCSREPFDLLIFWPFDLLLSPILPMMRNVVWGKSHEWRRMLQSHFLNSFLCLLEVAPSDFLICTVLIFLLLMRLFSSRWSSFCSGGLAQSPDRLSIAVWSPLQRGCGTTCQLLPWTIMPPLMNKSWNLKNHLKLIKRSEKSLWWSKCRSNIDQSYLRKYASWEIFPILASQPLCPPWPLDIIVPSDSLNPPLIRHWRVPATLLDPNSFYYPNPTQCIFQNIRV